MKLNRRSSILGAWLLLALTAAAPMCAARDNDDKTIIKHVLLISIDGMHALDFGNCARGVEGVDSGETYCPNLAELKESGVTYVAASATRPSDSFPGLVGEITGGTPRSAGVFYDVSYDRTLSPPAQTTPYGVVGGAGLCPGTKGTIVEYDESIGFDLTKLDGGGGINPNFLPRDPNHGCAPVYPHDFLRVNTLFEVVKEHGGYTAWSDKHLAYDIVRGPSGKGIDDFYSPEINSNVVPLNSVEGCSPLPDTSAGVGDWTTSFKDIQCYDTLKVNAILNEIRGKTHDGGIDAKVPTVFGLNFQAVSVGQKLVENGVRGGYLDALGTPTPELLSEIRFVDKSIGRFVRALKDEGLYGDTLIVITAKHGQSAIDPNRILRIPADDASKSSPNAIIGKALGAGLVANALEDDVSLMWLNDQSKTADAVKLLESNETEAGIGEIFVGQSLKLIFNDPKKDPRSPDIVVAPNVGVVYTGGKKKIAEHGGFANDDRNVMLLLSNANFEPKTVAAAVETIQVAPTILRALGLNPQSLDAVRKEHTSVLPFLPHMRTEE